jgi:hypothetical protein
MAACHRHASAGRLWPRELVIGLAMIRPAAFGLYSEMIESPGSGRVKMWDTKRERRHCNGGTIRW